ncbi:MAG: hypothetical protein WCB85_02880 [Candidatus Dormiibacterota bacterium]
MDEHSPAPAPGCRLLLLEDEPMVARILEHKLRREGHQVEWRRGWGPGAISGAAGFDVALVEVGMGGDSAGWMGDGEPPAVGWFAICEQRDAEAARRAVRAGAAGVVTKPFKPTEVAAKVRTLLELQRVPR